jgi:mRNA interferase HigB
MKLLGRNKLVEFQNKHADVRAWISAWCAEVADAEWSSPQDIRNRYASASIINRVVVIFNVKGNKYRLEVKVSYAAKVITVTRWGTHAEYDKWKQQNG